MKNKISVIENITLEDKIQIIMRQTNYTKEEAQNKLQLFEYDEISCIKDYMGITEKKALPKPVSVNQQIYKEIRHKIGISNIDLQK